MKILDRLRFSFPIYVTKRIGSSKKLYWFIRIGGILLAFLTSGLVSNMLYPGSFGTFYAKFFSGSFGGLSNIIDLLISFSLLLMIAIILTPAFKMRYWNIGAEGQILMGALAAGAIAKFCPSSMPNALIVILALFGSCLASTIWTLIPAFFKSFLRTNETLFTLMMNYVAALIVEMCISIWVKSGSQTFGMLFQGTLPRILGNYGTLTIIFAVLVFIGSLIYITKGKYGYEISVLGQSRDTARYVGIDEKKVTLRTNLICGFLFGIVGFAIVCGVSRTLSSTIVDGRGFTGVLIAWLGHFQPYEIALFSFLTALMGRGTTVASTSVGAASGQVVSASQFSAICTGVFFFIIIACEFFTNYRINIRRKEKGKIEEEAI